MSRTDPQFNLRIPEALRDQVMNAAKENGRSATAEILARLELSFLGDSPALDLMSAAKARQMSFIARQSIPATIKKRILEGISTSVAMGHAAASINLSDMELDALPQADVDALIQEFSKWLIEAGYEPEWDGPDSLWIKFDEL
ncbi:Arc family DNA-binding protein [Pseudomonas chlororaphis]|uniref:Arc family DNA-binding protein n=1 Tax=Pseudomonas chlororaphis TaxID=587753 RepID=UPI000F584E2B|nr:Arc family DNA-binding protein [Pseudomonas chlororaphis]